MLDFTHVINSHIFQQKHLRKCLNKFPEDWAKGSNMAPVSLFRGSNMAAVMSCENWQYIATHPRMAFWMA